MCVCSCVCVLHRPPQISTLSGEQKVGLDFADVWEESAQRKVVDGQVQYQAQPPPGAQPLHFDSEYAQGLGVQMQVLCK